MSSRAVIEVDDTWRNEALRQLMAFHQRPAFKPLFMLALASFFGDETLDGSRSPSEQKTALEASQASFISWFCFDFEIEPGTTIASRFLAEGPSRLTERQRAHIERLSASRLGVFEVLDVELDRGFSVLDLLTGSTLDVRERAATRSVTRFDLLVTRLVPFEDGVLEIEGGLMGYPSRCKPELAAFLAREGRRASRRRLKPTEATAFAKDPRFGIGLQRIWLDSTAFPPIPKLVTSEGEPVLLTTSLFDIEGRLADVESLLVAHPDLERVDEGCYSWSEPTRDGRRALGDIQIDNRRLTLDTMSRARAERGRRLLESALGGLIRHRGTGLQDPGVALREGRERAAAKGRDRRGPTPSEEQVLREQLDRHYKEWIDTTVPALDGLTPRQASRRKASRRKLVDLLKLFENEEARAEARGGHLRYDFGWLWAELGVTPE